MVSVNNLLAKIQEISNEHPTYLLGQDGSKGTCDCIGLIIGAFRRAGGIYKGTHGSNWSARNEMQTLEEPFKMEVGAVLYKAHLPGSKAWALPDSYKNHPDQKDYYHVGIVISTNPLRIAHCTKSSTVDGITVDTKVGVWRYGGRFDGVSYDNVSEEAPVVESVIGTALVFATSGTTVRMRVEPTTSAKVVAHVPVGKLVDILEKSGSWAKIRVEGLIGWMMASFLKDANQQPEPSMAEKVDILWAAHTATSGM